MGWNDTVYAVHTANKCRDCLHSITGLTCIADMPDAAVIQVTDAAMSLILLNSHCSLKSDFTSLVEQFCQCLR